MTTATVTNFTKVVNLVNNAIRKEGGYQPRQLPTNVAVVDLSILSSLFLEIVAIKTRVSLFVDNDEFITQVSNILSKHEQTIMTSSRNPSTIQCNRRSIEDEKILFDLYDCDRIPFTSIQHNTLSVLSSCLNYAITLFIEMKKKEDDDTSKMEEEVVCFLRDENNPDPNVPYCTGRIVRKQIGAYVYEGGGGAQNGPLSDVQIGIPPETIKASLNQGKLVPTVYVLPESMFNTDATNFADVEFPIYFNFFIQKSSKVSNSSERQKAIFVGSQQQIRRIKDSFRESIFGPRKEDIHIEEDICERKRKDEGYFVDLEAESEFLRVKDPNTGKSPSLEYFATFLEWNDGEVIIKARPGGELKVNYSKGLLRFYEEDAIQGAFDTSYFKDARPSQFKSKAELPSDEDRKSIDRNNLTGFEPPIFGVTFIGTSHGFDPTGITTGFILWINGNGILVDPPVQTPEFLKENGIQKKFVNKVILTHCHGDHDSGVIRQILEGERIEVYSTKTVIESYKRKLNAITGMKDLGDYFTFRQVKIGEITEIHEAQFEFDYAFHVIPTLRFKLSYCNKSISYSSDTFYHPQTFVELLKRGIISEEREMSLRMFVFDSDLIIHEAGIPPIHTPISVLNELPLGTKKKLVVVHTHSIPEFIEKVDKDGNIRRVQVNGLSIPKCGVKDTISIDVGQFNSGYAKANRLFQMVCNIFYFRNVSPSRIYSVFASLQQRSYKSGDIIIQQGDAGDTFFIIQSGEVEIYESNNKQKLLRVLTWGDCFGEGALNKDKNSIRMASVVAKTSCQLLSLSSTKFREIMRSAPFYNSQTPIENDVMKIQLYRPFVQEIVKKSYLFKTMKPEQIESIAALIDREKEYMKGDIIFKQNDKGASLFLIKQGGVILKRSQPECTPLEFKRLSSGETFGEIALITGLPRQATAIAKDDNTIVMELQRDSFMGLLDSFPNIHYNFMTVVEDFLQDPKRLDQYLKHQSSDVNPDENGC